MKKLLLLLLCVPLIGFSQSNEYYINNLITGIKSNTDFPQSVNIGTWEDVINEKNNNIVYIYFTSAKNRIELEKLLVLFQADKNSIINATDSESILIKELRERNINVIARYYNITEPEFLLMEIILKPFDWK